jgi:DNA-binding CsgD family transcriptional regulator
LLSSADHVLTLECDDVRLLALTAEGLSPAGIGRRMELNERTIRRRLGRLCERLGVSTPVQAVVWAVRHGVI